MGVPVGFVDADHPDVETQLPQRLQAGDWLILPACTHAHDAALRAVRARA